jgi:hypothetical protein
LNLHESQHFKILHNNIKVFDEIQNTKIVTFDLKLVNFCSSRIINLQSFVKIIKFISVTSVQNLKTVSFALFFSKFCSKTRSRARQSPFDVPDHPTLFGTLEVRSQINFHLSLCILCSRVAFALWLSHTQFGWHFAGSDSRGAFVRRGRHLRQSRQRDARGGRGPEQRHRHIRPHQKSHLPLHPGIRRELLQTHILYIFSTIISGFFLLGIYDPSMVK